MTEKVTVKEEEAGATTVVETDEKGGQTTGVETTPEKTTVEIERDSNDD